MARNPARKLSKLVAALVVAGGCAGGGGGSSRSSSGSSTAAFSGAGSSSGGSGGPGSCFGCLPPLQGPGLFTVDAGPPCNCLSWSLYPGWCAADGGLVANGAEPCPGFCVKDEDGGLNAPAAPCDGGCGWLGSTCADGSTSSCCAGLGCSPSGVGGQPDFCCAPLGFPCSPANVSGACCLGTACSGGECSPAF
jgi:hypothetical protein